MTEHASLVTLERRPDGVALVMIDNLPVISDDELDDAVRAVTEPAYIGELGGKYLATFDALAAGLRAGKRCGSASSTRWPTATEQPPAARVLRPGSNAG